MAELMKLLETNGAFKSDLMQTLLTSAQYTRDASLSGGSLPMTTGPIQSSSFLHSDVNLNISPALQTSPGYVGSNARSPSPFPNLPGTSTGINLNACDNTTIAYSNENLNGNTVYKSSTQFGNDNLPCPRLMSLDNLNASNPSNLNELDKTNLTSPDSRSNANINNNNSVISINVGATPDANGNAGSLRQGTSIPQNTLEPAGAKPTVPDNKANNAIDITQILSEVREGPSESRKLLIEQATAAIVDAHMNTTINTSANVAEARERIQRETSEMPDMGSLSMNGSNLWQHFMAAMLPEITKVIKFCTKLPGFPEVDQEDGIGLIKQGCFEVMVARFCMLVDHVNEEMLDPTLKMKAPRCVVKEMPMGPFLDQFFDVASQFNPLDLTDGEIGLFTAILMISPEREGLKNRTAIQVIQQLLIQALYLLLKESHKDAEQTLTSLLNAVPVFHKINEDHLKFLKIIKMKSPAEFEKKFPPLHKELFDTC